MSIDSSETPRQLPERPNLRHLKEQAKDLLRSGAATSTTDAKFQIARRYGFASWPKLKAHVEELSRLMLFSGRSTGRIAKRRTG